MHLCGLLSLTFSRGTLGGSHGKETVCNAGDLGSVPGLGRSPGEGNGYPVQYSGLENSMDCRVHRVVKSQTQLSDFHFHQLNNVNKLYHLLIIRWLTLIYGYNTSTLSRCALWLSSQGNFSQQFNFFSVGLVSSC